MKRLRRQFFYAEITFGILTLILGVLLQFLYKWTNYNYFAGIIAPVNESTWEHLKLLFFPILFLSIFEYFYIGKYLPPFITARTISCFLALIFTLIFFYTYTGIIGKNYLWADIFTFFLAVALCYCLTWHFTITQKTGNNRTNILCICLLIFMCYLFLRFTGNPPSINLFKNEKARLVFNPIFTLHNISYFLQ